MSHAQRSRRHRRGSGGPRNKALLALMVLGIAVVLAGLAGVGYVVSIASSAPPLRSIEAGRTPQARLAQPGPVLMEAPTPSAAAMAAAARSQPAEPARLRAQLLSEDFLRY